MNIVEELTIIDQKVPEKIRYVSSVICFGFVHSYVAAKIHAIFVIISNEFYISCEHSKRSITEYQQVLHIYKRRIMTNCLTLG